MTEWIEKTTSISEIAHLLDEYEVEVDSPDGWVGVNAFVDKGLWKEYILGFEDDWTQAPIRCNENHLFETTLGWQKAKDIIDQSLHFLTKDGWKKGKVTFTNDIIPIVDIQVNHSNHRYYTNGVSSHNTGVGKSLFMCHCAASHMNLGKKVLYITLEMSEEKIAERIDANLLNVNVENLKSLPYESFEKKIINLKSKITGKLIVKEYPTAAATAQNFRSLLNELRLKKEFVPDIIYIDYINICASARIKQTSNYNSYTYVKAIAEELRGLAVEYNVPIISATQTNRQGYNSSDVELTDTSESFGLPATADFMIAMISSEQLESLNQIMIKQLKNRYNDPTINKRFVIGIDRAKMRLYDVESSAQKDILDANQTSTTEDVKINSDSMKPSLKRFSKLKI